MPSRHTHREDSKTAVRNPRARHPRARYRRISRFAALNKVQEWWFELILPRLGLARITRRGRTARVQGIARHFHALAIELGGLMIKVGQFMSSRLDVLPPEITKELEGLQDEVPAVDFASIRMLADAELGMPLERAFTSVDPTPLAAASLGQAHRVRLSPVDAADTGLDEGVIKVQRPGIDEIVGVDLAALRRVAGWLSRVRIVSDHVDLPSLVEEFAHVSLEEIDYIHEAGNAERFAENFTDDPRVDAPQVVWERTTRKVLTLADVTAIKINDLEALRAAGIDPTEVASVFAAVMFDQLFSHGYFHADPHPGNIFVTPAPGGGAAGGRTWTLTFIDFGMMGEVTDSLRRGLQRLMIAVASRDGKALVESIHDVGVLLPSADTAELEIAMTQLFARFGGMGLSELQKVDPRELRDFATEFGDVVRALPFQLPENFLLIIRAMSLTSGMCSALNPRFNMWSAVEPYAAQLLREQGGSFVESFAKEALSTAGVYARLPRRLDELTTRLESGRLSATNPQLERRVARLERSGRRTVSAVVFAGLLISGVLARSENRRFGNVLKVAAVPALRHALLAGVTGRPGRSD
jgi:predicted unusual protein kinase regulating ubiquinone biosynthesis (AarF/ABC1/UbiB family)